MSSDFLADNNLCGQTILRLVSSGNAILASIFRLSSPENIPQVFRLASRSDQLKYAEIILDLRYFTDSESYEKKIEQNPILRELDDELRESYTKLLTEYYLLFESIYKYIIGLNKFIQEVHDGFYIQSNLENILSNNDGKQLLVESLYLYGCMLLLVDHYIDGATRERMITSFYRYSGRTGGGVEHYSEVNVDDVCKLLRSTKKGSANYPQDFFQRIEIDSTFIQLVLGRLRSDDIYNQLSSYPLPDHRTTALGSQASTLVIILFFCPVILHSENSTMREICDKFFHDNWIIPIYMGYSINLIEAWDGFKGAKMALELSIGINSSSTIPANATAKLQWPKTKIVTLTSNIGKILKEGVIVEDNILEKANNVITLLREANVILRWTMLHTGPLSNETSSKRSKQLRDVVTLDYDPEITLGLLLHVAQLELKVRDLYKKLLHEKQTKWMELRQEAVERVQELAEVFSGNKPLTRIEKNEKLSKWLETKATQINSLDYTHLTSSGRRITELIPAFNEMLEFHNLDAQVQVREWVHETTSCLLRMLRTGSINEDILVTLQIIGDLGYAWGSLIDNYTPQMQKLIQKDPFAVSKLRAVFLKLSSVMDMPLLRQSQTKSTNNELIQISSYYSNELVSYVQKVLQIIPESIFRQLHEIIELQTNYIQELPTRLDKDKVKELAQLEQRSKVSRLTHDMSILTEGILMMQSTLVGIICIDPKLLLELGIRKELIRQLIQTFNSNNTTTSSSGGGQQPQGLKFVSKLEFIASRLNGIQRSFEYIGDYINTHGLHVFQSELTRLTNFATEQETNRWNKIKILAVQSIWQSKDVPITLSSLLTSSSSSGSAGADESSSAGYITFMGKIIHELIGLTESKSTIYLSGPSTWYDLKTHVVVVSPEVFKLLEKAVDIVGLVGLDKILCFLIVKELEKLSKSLSTDLSTHHDFLTNINSELTPSTKLVSSMKSYTNWTNKIGQNKNVAGNLMKIGQLQLLRQRIAYQLKVSSNLNAKQLYSGVEVMNRLMSMALHEQIIEYEETAIDILNQSEPLGMYEPMTKIYIPNLFQRQKSNPKSSSSSVDSSNLGLYLGLVIIQQCKKLIYDKTVLCLVARKSSEPIDFFSLITGISTLLMQLNSSVGLDPFLSIISQYMNSMIVAHNTVSSSSPGIGLNKDDDFSSMYNFIKGFMTNYPKDDAKRIVKAIVPCFEMLNNFVM